jgi:GMP synthase-like glutamine amidotransferase
VRSEFVGIANCTKEIGWHPVKLIQEEQESRIFKALSEEFTAFHWHGDTFDNIDRFP